MIGMTNFHDSKGYNEYGIMSNISLFYFLWIFLVMESTIGIFEAFLVIFNLEY